MQHFFLKDGVLWRENGSGPPLMVILNPKVRDRIAQNAHNEAGHRGRDPMYQIATGGLTNMCQWLPIVECVMSAR